MTTVMLVQANRIPTTKSTRISGEKTEIRRTIRTHEDNEEENVLYSDILGGSVGNHICSVASGEWMSSVL